MQLVILLVLFVGLWVFMILPQQRKMKAHAAVIAKLEAGDKVMLNSGIFGSITEVVGDAAYIEIAEGIEILVAKNQVTDTLSHFPTEDAPVHDEEA